MMLAGGWMPFPEKRAKCLRATMYWKNGGLEILEKVGRPWMERRMLSFPKS